MLDTRHLAVLSAIADSGRFDLAASQLGITQSAVSQRLKALEAVVGGPLVVRGTPSLLTGQGQQLLAHFRKIQAMEAGLDLGGNQAAGPKRVAIAANADSVSTWLLQVLAPLARELNYRFDIRIDDQDVTRDLLRRGEVLACITSDDKPLSGCQAWPLGVMTYYLLASPGFRQRWFADGVTAEAAARAPMMVFNHKDELQHRFLQRQTGIEPDRALCHQVPSSPGFVEAIRRGFGYGMAPVSQVRPWLDNGALVDLTPDDHLTVPLYWHAWDLKGSVLDPVTDAVKAMKDRLDDDLVLD